MAETWLLNHLTETTKATTVTASTESLQKQLYGDQMSTGKHAGHSCAATTKTSACAYRSDDITQSKCETTVASYLAALPDLKVTRDALWRKHVWVNASGTEDGMCNITNRYHVPCSRVSVRLQEGRETEPVYIAA